MNNKNVTLKTLFVAPASVAVEAIQNYSTRKISYPLQKT